MITSKDIIADMHTHTIFSEHAFSTLKENMDVAYERGLKVIANTDHLYQHGAPLNIKNEAVRIRITEQRVNKLATVKVIGSAEFNVGQPIYNMNYIEHIKWKPLGLHGLFIDTASETFDSLYEDYLKRSDWNNAFVHIERELDAVNHGESKFELTKSCKEYMEKLVLLAKRRDIYLEINEASFEGGELQLERLRYWLKIAKENGNRIYLGTDAHFCDEVGEFTHSIELINEIGYDKNLILNCDEERVMTFLE